MRMPVRIHFNSDGLRRTGHRDGHFHGHRANERRLALTHRVFLPLRSKEPDQASIKRIKRKGQDSET